jgi:cytochrome c oxidase assembly protein subunit 15
MIKYDKIDKLFYYWLSLSLILVFIIIIVGGLTRLTNSGLSITEWELFSGILPPLNQTQWINYFDAYKSIPQFRILNPDMSLNEFKVIFYWEYFHRVLARTIGIFFFIPLIYFYFTKKIDKYFMNKSLIVFSLIVLQGFVGWYMVMSGLVNDVTVSHYRLSIHLSLALIIISMIFWMMANIKNRTFKVFFSFSKKNLPYLILIIIIFFQIIMGAFVSGLDAGLLHQTWPLMGNNFFPDDIVLIDLKNLLNFNDHSLVQFYHRNLAYLISVYIILFSIYIFRKNIINLYKPLKILIIALVLQILLGILTLLSGLNIYLASAHQITSVVLVFSSINLYYHHIK